MNKKAFSLIELIVWITISMILMVSVGIFISHGMQNIFLQQRVLENTDNFTDFAGGLNTSFNLIQSWSFAPVETLSWILFKRWQNFWEWGFTYIWTEILDWVYCESGSEDTNTNSVFIKNFIPFEENWEDTFSDYSKVLTWSVVKWADTYISNQKEHSVTKNWTLIVWKWVFWDKFNEWAKWTDIYLNSPTWLATDWTGIFISDTLNDRILYLDNTENIHLLLDSTDWLNEPTGLYYNDNELYIANSWNWEILKYSSKSGSQWILTMTWITESDNINKIELSFYNQKWFIQNITQPIESDVTFSVSKNDDYLEKISNKLKYYFVNYSWVNISLPECTLMWEKIWISWNPINCTSFWTWQISNSVYKNFINSSITINNIENLSGTWSYYVNLKLFDWLSEKYSDYFPYFTQGDNDLSTLEDNILTVEQSGLNYPTGIWWASNYNQFLDWTYSDILYDKTDTLLGTPIKSLDITNIPNNLISLFLKYYKSYDCYNLDNKAERSFLLKKNLK